jgi:hypothetical protein
MWGWFHEEDQLILSAGCAGRVVHGMWLSVFNLVLIGQKQCTMAAPTTTSTATRRSSSSSFSEDEVGDEPDFIDDPYGEKTQIELKSLAVDHAVVHVSKQQTKIPNVMYQVTHPNKDTTQSYLIVDFRFIFFPTNT